jgi:diamine N-acetyltransferase
LKTKIFIDFYFIYTLPFVKSATIADIPLIIELAMQVWPQTYTPILGSEQVAYMLRQFYSPASLRQQMEAGHQFVICYADEGQPVAFASWSRQDALSCKLHKIYIVPAVQGRGVGRFIIHHISAALIKEGIKALFLNVNRYNETAIRFYSKYGFMLIADEDIDIGSGYFMNDHVFSLELEKVRY